MKKHIGKNSVTTPCGPDLSHIAESLHGLAFPLADLAFMVGNAVKHPERQLEELRASLRQFGQVEPLVVNRRETPPVVIGGNGRLQAMLAEGRTHGAVCFVDMDRAKANALSLALNRTADGREWNKEALDALLRDVNTGGDAKLDAMLSALATEQGVVPPEQQGQQQPEAPEAQVDRAAELLAKWQVEPGQLWEIPSKTTPGKAHRLLCGDSTNPDSTDRVLSGEKIEAVLTDPPYSSGGQFRGDRNQATGAKYVRQDTDSPTKDLPNFAGDNRDQRAFLSWASMWLGKAFAASKVGAIAMVFIDWRQMPVLTDAIQAGGWVWRNIVTWWKPGIRMQRGRFSSSSEYVVYASNGVPIEGEESPQNVLQVAPVASEDKEHIAEKPLELLRQMIGVTKAGALLCDPFLGSAATMVAAEQTGRLCCGIEISPAYVAVALERLSQMGLSPELVPGS